MAFPCEPVVETRFDIFTEYAREQPIGRQLEMGERAGADGRILFSRSPRSRVGTHRGRSASVQGAAVEARAKAEVAAPVSVTAAVTAPKTAQAPRNAPRTAQATAPVSTAVNSLQ